MTEVYRELDKMMAQADHVGGQRYTQQGCTAISCFLQGTKKGVFANAGDSRAFIGTKNGAVRLETMDHKLKCWHSLILRSR